MDHTRDDSSALSRNGQGCQGDMDDVALGVGPSRHSDAEGGKSSTLTQSLREECADVRQQSAHDVMKLLASQQDPNEDQQKLESAKHRYESNAPSVRDNSLGGLTEQAIEDTSSSSQARRQSEARKETPETETRIAGEDIVRAPFETCVECEDQHAELECLSCTEPFCRPCWDSLHRRGRRAEHKTQAILGDVMPAPTSEPDPPSPPQPCPMPEQRVEDTSRDKKSSASDGGHSRDEDGADTEDSDEEEQEGAYEDANPNNGKRHNKRRRVRGLAVGLNGSSVLEECRYIPLRLDERERRLLSMLKGALNFSEYTDRIDVFTRLSKAKMINAELRKALGALAGMMMAGDAKMGEKGVSLLENLEDHNNAFAEIFEVGRRFKVTNPEKFRSFYGKMMYMLQDATQGRSEFNLVKDIQMVHGFVEDRSGLALLKDKRIVIATADVSGLSMSREEIREKVKLKNEARAMLLRDYVSDSFSARDIERVLDSIADANNYLVFNVGPVERMLDLLRQNFHPDKPEEEWSLKLVAVRKRFSSSSLYNSGYGSFGSYGYGGGYSMSMFGSSTAMLSHDHQTQYAFVMQSLRLWSEAMRNMYRLWYFADRDLLSGKATYRLCNTGQGLNRVQSCPSVSIEMRRILGIVQSECGPWVGLSVVHLGDRDVPNALMFIDKYTQIPRILNPVAEVIHLLGEMALDPVLGQYVDVGWGGVHNAKMAVLSDFFKGGFDGSGDDGGSCIDGRLTSAWNWCSLLHKKAFAPIFSLAGQYGFDGGWGEGLEA